jgi:K(+)-stimulated pyrophosphate-energized sodium pump
MKCDMSKCSKMTKDECAKMCDENGCSAEEKAICMSHYDENGKWKGGEGKKDCCKKH